MWYMHKATIFNMTPFLQERKQYQEKFETVLPSHIDITDTFMSARKDDFTTEIYILYYIIIC